MFYKILSGSHLERGAAKQRLYPEPRGSRAARSREGTPRQRLIAFGCGCCSRLLALALPSRIEP